MKQQTQATTPQVVYSTNVLERRQRAAAEYLTWADHHAQLVARRAASQAQLEAIQPLDNRNAFAQQKAWARRRMHERHLHDSALAQLRHR